MSEVVSNVVRLNVCMIQRDALLLPEGSCADGHRGVWFCSPEEFEGIVVGCEVEFWCAGLLLVRGRVTAIVRPEDYPKYCSRVASKGFTWEEIRP